jgi:putative ABC transport system permease protein
VLRFFPYILKSLWRHRARTVLTVSGAAVALFVFAFVGAAQEGLADLTRSEESERTLIVFQANRFCPSTSRIPDHYAETIAKMDGVEDAVPIKVFLNNCRASLDVIVFNGMPAKKLAKARDLKLVEGDWSNFKPKSDAALVGRAVAQRRSLSVGNRFSIGEVKVTVAGIFTAPLAAEENFIYTDLEFLQRTPGLNSVGTVTQIEVRLTPSADPDQVARAIDTRFRGGPIQTDTRPKGVFQANAVSDLAELIGFANYLGFACVGMVLALVATTTLMTVQDRVREHAVLQTLGFTGSKIFGLVMTESFLVSLLGGLIGTGLAIGWLAWRPVVVGTEGTIIALTPSLPLAFVGLVVSIAAGLLAGVVPAWQAARADIVPSLRYI